MTSGRKLCYYTVLACLFLSTSMSLCAQQFYNSTANVSTTWINQPSMIVKDSGTFSPILMRLNGPSAFYCGFYCVLHDGDTPDSPDSTDCLYCNDQRKRNCTFGVFITIKGDDFNNDADYYIRSPQLVWSPNRNNPVQVNASFQLSQDGDLMLTNSDGALVWSSKTAGNSVAGMNLTEDGDLVLFGQNKQPIWQSFDYPADSLLPGQRLNTGQRLTASVSASNLSEGSFYLSVDSEGWGAYVNSNPPQRYYSSNSNKVSQYVVLKNGSLIFQNYINTSPRRSSRRITLSAAFMKLKPNGHLKAFQHGENVWTEVDIDLLDIISGDCGYPLVCGNYGLCSDGVQCGCLETTSDQGNFFREINFRKPNLGCYLATPISCNEQHILLEMSNSYYFAFTPDQLKTTLDDCKNLCLTNCSCKAAVFGKEASKGRTLINGSCLLLNEVFSIANNENSLASPYNTTLYVKAQLPYETVKSPNYVKVSTLKVKILASAVATIFVVFCVIGTWLLFFWKRDNQQSEIEEDFLDQVPGMPTRYSYENLKGVAEDFSKKLGEGGFGCVYEGKLSDGTTVAVKCLDGLAKVRDSFLVEVKAIGGIHHVNLVKLIGFCFEKSHRLLVYEYMANKSLDRWIFHENEEKHCLQWHIRKNIITDIAKGLAYLHEECSPKIIHLDIKPENILLDENFNAKISDFGLSKLIEKDQSRVITTMRGTPGYLAPEWLSAAITEKADVYSFGIVMLEIICGRKNLDSSRIEGEKHLLAAFKRKAEEGKLKELVDERSEDMRENAEEAVEMMKIAAWCLQGDFTKRPSMSLVVKVLEGLIASETNIEYDFLHPKFVTRMEGSDPWEEATFGDCTRLLPSALSGPR